MPITSAQKDRERWIPEEAREKKKERQTDGRKEKDMLAKEKLEPACAEEDVYIGGREG